MRGERVYHTGWMVAAFCCGDVDVLRVLMVIDALFGIESERPADVLSFHGRAFVVADAAGNACEAL